MTTFLVSLQDQGKTNVALKFNKEDGILKYYNDFGDFSCFVQAQPSVYLDVVLVTNKGHLINHETHIGKGKKKEGSVFQTNPTIIQTDHNGKLKISFRFENKQHCIVSSPFVGATKDPYQTLVGGRSVSYLSNITYEEYMANHQLTTMIVYKNSEYAELLSNITKMPIIKTEKTNISMSSNGNSSKRTTSTTSTLESEPINFVIHQLNANDEVLSYFKDITPNCTLEELLAGSTPNATYKLSKARSLSHQSADSIDINKETNNCYLEKRAKIFVNQLINWEKRGHIHALERDQILRDAVRQFDFYLKQELSAQLSALSAHQANVIHSATMKINNYGYQTMYGPSTASQQYPPGASHHSTTSSASSSTGSAIPGGRSALSFATANRVSQGADNASFAPLTAAMMLPQFSPAVNGSNPLVISPSSEMENNTTGTGDDENISEENGVSGSSPCLSRVASDSALHQQVPPTFGSYRYRENYQKEMLAQQLQQTYQAMSEYKGASAQAVASTAKVYKPQLKLDALQSTIESFIANKQAVFAASNNSIAKSMAIRSKRENENGITMEEIEAMNGAKRVKSEYDGVFDGSSEAGGSSSSSLCINELVSTPILNSACALEGEVNAIQSDEAAAGLMALLKKK